LKKNSRDEGEWAGKRTYIMLDNNSLSNFTIMLVGGVKFIYYN